MTHATSDNSLRSTLVRGVELLTQTQKLQISERQLDLLLDFLNLLIKWNKAYNLTAVRDPRQMVSYHLLDSLSVQPHLDGKRIIDIGTGAGLPGMPLAILNPERSFLLLDSNSKKTRFIKQAVVTLGLENVSVWHGRSEHYEAGPGFDTVTCRALASVPRLLEIGAHLLGPSGRLVAQKGFVPEDELAHLADGWEARSFAVDVPFLEEKTRHIIVLQNAAPHYQS